VFITGRWTPNHLSLPSDVRLLCEYPFLVQEDFRLVGHNSLLVPEHQIQFPLVSKNPLLILERLIELVLVGEDPPLVRKDFFYFGHKNLVEYVVCLPGRNLMQSCRMLACPHMLINPERKDYGSELSNSPPVIWEIRGITALATSELLSYPPQDATRKFDPVSERHRRRSGIILFIAIVQGILFLAHALVFETVNYFWGKPRIPHLLEFFILASISFVPASLLVWRYTHLFAWVFYRLAAIWLGLLSFFFWASVLCWGLYAAVQLYALFGSAPRVGDYGHGLLLAIFTVAAGAAAVALVNATRLRVTEISVTLRGLPDLWKSRTAVLVGDLHLGPVRGFYFVQRIVRLAARLNPDTVFLTGDFYDGTAVDEVRMASAWKEFAPNCGIYYVTGNHEEFSDRTNYLNAIEGAGIRVLRNEKVVVDGLQIAGVLYGEGHEREAFRRALQRMNLDPTRPAILLSHVPQFYDVAEEAGISLKLSGHTHNGQVIPWNWVARRVHGKFVYGLNKFKSMLVYTTSGAGTWGPPMRLATRAEVVLVRFH